MARCPSGGRGRSHWTWTAPDWATLCCPSAEEFLAARTLPTEITVRPFLVALGYLLGGFTDAQQLGTFNRLHLAQLVFGADLVEDSMRRAGEILGRVGLSRRPDRAAPVARDVRFFATSCGSRRVTESGACQQ